MGGVDSMGHVGSVQLFSNGSNHGLAIDLTWLYNEYVLVISNERSQAHPPTDATTRSELRLVV